MANLAIRGHSTRGKEVIEILKMLGGKISHECGYEDGFDFRYVYFIDTKENFFIDGFLLGDKHSTYFSIFTLEEFLEKFPYKVGDKVRTIYGKEGTISRPIWSERDNCVRYELEADVDSFYFTNELQPHKEQETMEDNSILNQLSELDSKTFADGYDQGYDDGQHDMTEWNLPDGFIFKDEDGNVINANKIVLEKIKPQYYKTYDGCCEALYIAPYYNLKYHTFEHDYHELATSDKLLLLQDKLNILSKLLICRNAYWKLAGDWKPKFIEDSKKYVIVNYKDKIVCSITYNGSAILAFPTEEMRDAFYENYNELIESCKELL